jgi:hypothetical protein
MLVTACELIFVESRPGRPEVRRTYPVGTQVAACPAGADDESRYLTQRVNELQARDGVPYRIILLDGQRRIVAASKLSTKG